MSDRQHKRKLCLENLESRGKGQEKSHTGESSDKGGEGPGGRKDAVCTQVQVLSVNTKHGGIRGSSLGKSSKQVTAKLKKQHT